MPRDIAASLGTRLDAQVTAVGYLLRAFAPAVHSLAVPSTIYLSDLGDMSNALGSWTGEDFDVKGTGTENVTVTIQNLNNAAGAFVLNASALGDVVFELWQFERGDPDNPVYLGEFRAANAKIGIDRVDLALRQANLQYRFAPVRRINARDGFHYALRPGEILYWGTQRIVIRGK